LYTKIKHSVSKNNKKQQIDLECTAPKDIRTSNESRVPAQMTSPLWSAAKETNCLEEGVVNVLKFR
jgi:hypothetical protein